jgi:hypothetical protein
MRFIIDAVPLSANASVPMSGYHAPVIRRDRPRQDGSIQSWWLINQHDHALLAGELARHLGGRLIEKPTDERFFTAVAQHDCGWPLHDDAPTLDALGRPRDVFESQPPASFQVWQASAERAAAIDPYAGLLVSLHSLALSLHLASATNLATDPSAVFDLNKFQHRMIELQEELRRKLGFRTDLPLLNGLAETAGDPNEKRLAFHFRLLQAMDQLSLDACCTHAPAERTQIAVAPGGRTIVLAAKRTNDMTLQVAPWPFDVSRLAVRIPYRELPAYPYADVAQFHADLKNALLRELAIDLIPAHG